MKILAVLTILLITNTIYASDNLDLKVQEIRKSNPSYESFCERFPGECDLSGKQIILFSKKLLDKLKQINIQVNSNIIFITDPEFYDVEDFWSYPLDGFGDCEDNALEKRRLLVESGIPRGALKLVTAFHETQYYAHGLLSVETDIGTFILDQDSDKILLWHQTPYIFESRENSDGSWNRFVQEW